MGTLQFSDLKDEVLQGLGNRTGIDSSRLARVINLAQMRIARVKVWDDLETVVEGTFSITSSAKNDKFLTLPTNVRTIYSVRVIIGANQSRKLQYVPPRKFDEKIPEPEYYSRGKPTIYTLYSGKLELWKVPDSTYSYSIRMATWPSTLSSDSDVSDLDQKDDMIIALSLSWMFQSIGRTEDASRWWRIYANMLNSATGEETEKLDMDLLPSFESMPGNAGVGDYYVNPFVKGV